MADRPTPITTTDELLSHVLDELQGLRADLAGRGGAADPPDGGKVELREPRPAPAKKATAKRAAGRKS